MKTKLPLTTLFILFYISLFAQSTMQKIIGGNDQEAGLAVIQTSDGGYAISGGTFSHGAGYYDVYIIKLSPGGAIQWTKTIGGAGDDAGYSLIQTQDGGYALCGSTNSFGAGDYDIYVVK